MPGASLAGDSVRRAAVLVSGDRARDLEAGSGVELGQDVGDVGFDGVAGQEHLGGDVGVGPPGGDEVGDFLFGGGEGLPAGGGAVAGALGAAADVVLAQPGVGAHDVPGCAEVVVDGDGLFVGGAGGFGVAVFGVQHGGVLQCLPGEQGIPG